MIPFQKPYLTGDEKNYLEKVFELKHFHGNGFFTKKCHDLIEEITGVKKALLTTSCTDALEMAALLTDIKPGDKVAIPSFTFVSTANAFVLRGAEIIFLDSQKNHPNMCLESLREALNSYDIKAVVPVHYAGQSCPMDEIVELSEAHNFLIVEDAAQAIGATYKGKALGTLGDLGTFSFHETKNLSCGEGGSLLINKDKFKDRSEIIWEKGTNRSAFIKGKVDKYGWVDLGSSFLPSELNAAYLCAQLENLKVITQKRMDIWNFYDENIKPLVEKGFVTKIELPKYSSNNGHIYCVLLKDKKERDGLMAYLKKHRIQSAFHYQTLHESKYYAHKHDGRELKNSTRYMNTILRLPIFGGMTISQAGQVIEKMKSYFEGIK